MLDTSISLSCPDHVVAGEVVMLIARVQPSTATGTVSFLCSSWREQIYEGPTRLGTVALSSGGEATLKVPRLQAQEHLITAHFSADEDNYYEPSMSGAGVVVVDAAEGQEQEQGQESAAPPTRAAKSSIPRAWLPLDSPIPARAHGSSLADEGWGARSLLPARSRGIPQMTD